MMMMKKLMTTIPKAESEHNKSCTRLLRSVLVPRLGNILWCIAYAGQLDDDTKEDDDKDDKIDDDKAELKHKNSLPEFCVMI